MLVNGKKVDLAEDMTIEVLIKYYDLDEKFIVVEVDGEIVPKSNYKMKLKSDSRVEIVSFVGGG